MQPCTGGAAKGLDKDKLVADLKAEMNRLVAAGGLSADSGL